MEARHSCLTNGHFQTVALVQPSDPSLQSLWTVRYQFVIAQAMYQFILYKRKVQSEISHNRKLQTFHHILYHGGRIENEV